MHGVILEGADRPLHVKFADEQHSKHVIRDPRYIGGRGVYREMDQRRMRNPYGSPISMPLSVAVDPQRATYSSDMRYHQYPLLNTNDAIGWMGSPYSSPRQLQHQTPYGNPYGRNYDRRQSPMYMAPPTVPMSVQESRPYGYLEIASLRISE